MNKLYVDLMDENDSFDGIDYTGMYGVFHEDTGKCYNFFYSEHEAIEWLNEVYKTDN
jgi:hypothetical protein